MSHPETCACAVCGAEGPLLDFGFQLPDCIWAQPAADRGPGNTTNFASLGARGFIRAVMPVPLASGDELRFGIWLEVDAETFAAAPEIWDDEERYMAFRFHATIANVVPPWGDRLLGTPVEAAPRIATHRPIVVASAAPWLQHDLVTPWSMERYADVVARLRG